MTAQIHDSLYYKRKEYDISAIEHPSDFFDIHSLGFRPRMMHTACYRGYVATFVVRRKHLYLDKLSVNDHSKSLIPINNKMPQPSRPPDDEEYDEKMIYSGRNREYIDIALPLLYTGSIIITDDFIEELYVHMGFQAPYKFLTVLQLTFKDGLLVSTNDLSSIAATIRERIEADTLDDETDERDIFDICSEEWVMDCFDISFPTKARGLIDDE